METEIMKKKRRSIGILIFLLAVALLLVPSTDAQSLKKVRMGSSSTNVSFLALYTALHRGFFKDEGIDLEIVFMPANLASTAVLNGDVDFNGAVTGTIGAAVQGRPMKVLLFTVSKPLLFLMGQKNIKDVKQLKGKKIAGSSPGGSATLLANQALKQIGLEPGKDVSFCKFRQRGEPASGIGIRRRRSVADFRAGKHHRPRKGL
jgi:NitT/TauT family transport system substrate-binding protein